MTLFNDQPGVPRKLSASDQEVVRSRIDRMIRALSTGVYDAGASGLPSACTTEIAHLAQDLAAQYRRLVATGLTNMRCGLSNADVAAIADEASHAYQRTIITLSQAQMEKHLATGASQAGLAAVYGSVVCGLHLAASRAYLNVRVPGPDGTATTRKVSVKSFVSP